MPTYKVKEEDSFWHGGKVTKVERVTDAQDVANAVGTGIGFLLASHQNAKLQNAERAVKSAVNFLENGEFDQAIKSADELLKIKEDQIQVSGHYVKARAFSALNHYREAIAEYTSAIELAQSANQLSEISFILWERGIRYVAINDLSSAMKDFTRFIQLKPKEDTGYQLQGCALKELGDLEQALVNFNKAVEINPGNATNYRERGLVYVEMKNFTRAFQDYSRAITLAPQDALTYKLRGDLYFLQKNYQQAIADYSRAIQSEPNNLEYYKLRAELYHLTGDETKSQADSIYINQEKSYQWAYEEYLRTAKQLVAEGVTKTFAEIQEKVSSSWGCAIIGVTTGILLPLFILTKGTKGLEPLAFVILLLTAVFIFIVIKEMSSDTNLGNTYLKVVAEKESYMPGFTEFFNQYLKARKEVAMQDLVARTRPLFETEGPASNMIQFYKQNYLQRKLVSVIEGKGDIYFSDIRDVLAELKEAGKITDINAARLEISRLVEEEEVSEIDEDDLDDLESLIQNPNIKTLDDLLVAMEQVINAE